MRTKLLITVLAVTFAGALCLQAQTPKKSTPVKAAPSTKAAPKPAAKVAVSNGPALSAYERLDQWLLAETLSSMHMTDALRGMAAENKGDTSVNGLSGYISAMIGLANSETDPAVRRKLLDQAAESLPDLIKKTPKVNEEDVIKVLGYRLKLVDLLGRSQVSLHADVLIMLMGGEEDRRIIMGYTAQILTAKKEGGSTGRSMLEMLQDDIDQEVEKVHGDPANEVNNLPPLQTLQHELKYSSAWFKLYRGLASSVVAERADLLQSASVIAEPYAKGEWEGAESPDPASLLLQGEASTELGVTWRMKAKEAKGIDAETAKSDAEKEFDRASKFFDSAMNCKSAPDDQGKQTVLISPDLKAIVLYQIARNLIEWGKYTEALKAVNEYGPAIIKPELLGKDAAIRADVNTAMLKNHLYMRWAENATDKTQADNYRLESQKALLDFLTAHKEQKAIVAAFYKIIANKYRDAPTPPAGVANDDKYVDEYLGKLNPIFQFAIAQDEFNSALDLCGQKELDKLKAALKVPANAEAKKKMEKTDKLLTMIVNDKSEDAASLQSPASELAGVVEELLDMGWEAGKISVRSGKKDGVLNGCAIFRRILLQTTGAKVPEMRKEFIAAMVTLLGNAEWVKDPKVSIWYVDLGEQYSKSADAQSAPEKKIADYQEGIKAYRQVPQANLQMYMEAQHRALGMEYNVIMTMHDTGGETAKIGSAAGEFSTRLQEYVKQVKSTITQVTGTAGAKPSDDDKRYLGALKYWGADSAFLSSVVMCDYLNLRKEGMDALDKLPDQWPDVDDVLRDATDYEVRKHIEASEINEASEHIEAMRRKYPDKANALMQQVIGKLRKQIHDSENDPSKIAQVKKQRETYLTFSNELLKTHPGDYSFEQMHADALLQNGQLDEALVKFEGLAKTEQDNRVAKEKKTDEFVDSLAAAMDKAQGNIPEVLRLAEELPKVVREKGIDPSAKGYMGALATVLAYAKKPTTDPEDAQERAKQVTQVFKQALAGLRKDLKATLPRDAVNMAGLAKLYKLQKKYDKALENYNPLVAGLGVMVNDRLSSEQTRKSYVAQYAQTLLERTQCKYEFFLTTADAKKKKSQMQNLVLEIKAYKDRDSELWGLFKDFHQIESDAQKAAGT